MPEINEFHANLLNPWLHSLITQSSLLHNHILINIILHSLSFLTHFWVLGKFCWPCVLILKWHDRDLSRFLRFLWIPATFTISRAICRNFSNICRNFLIFLPRFFDILKHHPQWTMYAQPCQHHIQHYLRIHISSSKSEIQNKFKRYKCKLVLYANANIMEACPFMIDLPQCGRY